MNLIIDMVKEHWFWGLITLTVLVWYSIITIYVAYRGAYDIKHMLRDLAAKHAKRQVHR